MKHANWMLAVAMAIGCAVPLRAEDAPATQPATQPVGDVIQVTDGEALKAKMGEMVTVEGVIQAANWSSTGKVMNVFFKDVDRGLIVVVFEKNKDKFNAAFGGDATAAWNGAKVRVTGKLQEYGGRAESMKGRPQIILQNPEQITVIEPPAK